MSRFVVAALLGCIAFSAATVHFKETFGSGWEHRWVKGKAKESEGMQGDWVWSAGKYYGDAEEDKGIKTNTDARFYQISAEFPEFSNKGKDLVVQYSVKHEQRIDCGGGYIKLLPSQGAGWDASTFHGETSYNIMFGPDICGSSTKKTHLIFNYHKDGKNHLVKREIRAESDEHTHLYTLVLHPDNTYEVYIDGKEAQKGNLKDDFDMLPPKEIKDPKASKPSDWVDERQIADPTDKKPEGWDDTPREIRDPDAKKPDDWDDDLDGEWEAPMVANPDWKGDWKPRMIDNPAYKGEWVHPMVANPDYFEDDSLYSYPSFKHVGIEVWQVKAGTIFDNFLIADSKHDADKAAETVTRLQEAEKKAEEQERKKREEEAKAHEEANAGKEEDVEHDHVHDDL